LADLTGDARADYVREMFSDIARHYDILNRLMTFGQDIRWRREVIRQSRLTGDGKLLDLGTGTGDLAREALRQAPQSRVSAADFTLEMMLIGRARSVQDQELSWSAADALHLPFPENFFDAVVSAFLLRNVSDLKTALQEQYRVLKQGGILVSLDTTPTPRGLLGSLVRFHMHRVIPALGRVISGNKQAYQYLSNSTEAFLEPQQLTSLLHQTGFLHVDFQRFMLGTIAIYRGEK
jgi:demethylmenaquinone methyltransferase / 2-methoxy-6-polyprenyl-1,4-benzoquinol methylase